MKQTAGVSALTVNIATLIENKRQQKNMSQSELAERIGVDEITIRRYELCVVPTPLEVIYKIAIALNVDVNEFFPTNEWYEEFKDKKVKRIVTFELTDEECVGAIRIR